MKAYLIGVSFLALAACTPQGNYRPVKLVPSKGGDLALEGDKTMARQKAEGYMASTCSSGYDVLEEGEVVVGSEQQSESSANRFNAPWKIGQTNTATSTVDKREWRIRFQCKGATLEAAPKTEPKPGDPAAPKPSAKIHSVIVTL